MVGKVIISDYDDTILYGSDVVFRTIFRELLGSEEFEKLRSLSCGRSYIDVYISQNLLNKE